MWQRLKLYLVKTIFYAIGYTPLPIVHAVGGFLGVLIFFLPLKVRYHAQQNIHLCFPELSFWQRQWLLVRALKEIGKGLLEAPTFWVRSQKHLVGLVRGHEALAVIKEQVDAKKGAILLGLHLGGFYLKNPFISSYLPNTAYLYKPQKGVIGELMAGMLDRFAGKLVSTSKEGVLTLFRSLKKGDCVGMICDHNVLDNGSVWAPYFGHLVPTTTLPGKLAYKTQAPVYLGVMERLSWGRGYQFHLWTLPPDIASEDDLVAATAMNHAVEKAVRAIPTQHEWLYRRFWDRPEGAPSVYKTQRSYVKPAKQRKVK